MQQRLYWSKKGDGYCAEGGFPARGGDLTPVGGFTQKAKRLRRPSIASHQPPPLAQRTIDSINPVGAEQTLRFLPVIARIERLATKVRLGAYRLTGERSSPLRVKRERSATKVKLVQSV